MSSAEEQEYIWGKLIPELQSRMQDWAAEYKQPRELGVAGEFVGLHRKVGKLKTIVWDGVDASGWREDPETILFEVAAHALLMLYDVHHQRPRMAFPEPEEVQETGPAPVIPKSQRTHEYRGETHHNHSGVTCLNWSQLLEVERRG